MNIERLGRIKRIARDLGNCADAWETNACLLGNVTADEIRDLCQWVIEHGTPRRNKILENPLKLTSHSV